MIESEQLKQPGLAHGFFTRAGGHSTGIFASLNCGMGSGDDIELVMKNRAVVARALGVEDGNVLSAHQVHSAEAIVVDRAWPLDGRPKVDGLATRSRGLALGVLTADCGPVLFADSKAQVIGACHAGWKGALTGVADATVERMVELGASRGNIVAVLGPTISKTNYEVGPEFPKPFLEQAEAHQKFFTPSPKAGHFMFDLPAYLTQRLRGLGLHSVSDLGLCTYADEARFYSYRRATHRSEADYGRLISAIALV
jgi:polyphenol oxidase